MGAGAAPGQSPDPIPGSRSATIADRTGGVRFLFGTMPEGAAWVQARRSDVEGARPAFHDVLPENGPRIWILTTGILLPETITFLNGSNQPVEAVHYTPLTRT